MSGTEVIIDFPIQINDEPTLDDRLDRATLICEVSKTIAECVPPMVLGIHGEWGCGKTSFLQQLHLFLNGECSLQPDRTKARRKLRSTYPDWEPNANVTVIWFEAWRYQYEETPIVALLQEIRSQLSTQKKVINKIKAYGEVVVNSALVSFEDCTKKVGIQFSKAEERVEKWEKDNLAYELPSHMIRRLLQHALNQILGDANSRLVILVDDLDRCEGDTAYKLLEGIKIYLNIPNCVFVLGMNQEIIEYAIADHLPKQDIGDKNRKIKACEYLEKLCQHIYHLPVITKPGPILEELLAKRYPTTFVADIKRNIEEFDFLPRNPRKIKRYINTLLRFKARFPVKENASYNEKDIHTKMLLIMSSFYLFHHDLYRLLEVDPEFIWVIQAWVEPQITDHPLLQRLSLPYDIVKRDDSRSATPLFDAKKTYPDPVEENVFRLQKLVKELGVLVTPELISQYII